MNKSLTYYASARQGSHDELVLNRLESNLGSQLEQLETTEKATLLILLTNSLYQPSQLQVTLQMLGDDRINLIWNQSVKLTSRTKLGLIHALTAFLSQSESAKYATT